MAQIFPSILDKLLKGGGLAAPLIIVGLVMAVNYWFSPKFLDAGYQPLQPVEYDHSLHAGELGIDCRYCHNTVEEAAHAAVPPTATCMNCHSLIHTESEKLELVRDSWYEDTPIEWNKVHLLADYSYFDHSIHISAGVGCTSCHGRIDEMEVVWQEEPLSMGWCLDCHRNPTPHLRPHDEVFNMAYDPVVAGYDPSTDENRKRDLEPPVHCSGCHR